MDISLIRSAMDAQDSRIRSQGLVKTADEFSEDEDAAVAWGGSEAVKTTLNMVRGAKSTGVWGHPMTMDAVLQYVALVCFHAGLAYATASKLEEQLVLDQDGQ